MKFKTNKIYVRITVLYAVNGRLKKHNLFFSLLGEKCLNKTAAKQLQTGLFSIVVINEETYPGTLIYS